MNRRTLQKIYLVILCFISTNSLSAQPSAASVGTPKATFSVNNSGAAIYDVQIEMPNGGKLTPNISINYNSQSTYGLVGYGCTISGIYSITRGGKDLYHDNTHKGATYKTDDSYYLNGVRLILHAGAAGKMGSIYTPEGSPNTKVIVHNDSDSPNSWFEVRTPDGLTYQYGNSGDSRLIYRTKSGQTHIAAWYVSKVENIYKDYTLYKYQTTPSLCIYPISIIYGQNEQRSRGIFNIIDFTYTNLGSQAVPFKLDGMQAKTDQRLSTITTSSNNKIYRKYKFSYVNEDAGHFKYSRLSEVEEENGNGEKLNPIRISWEHLPFYFLDSEALNVSTNSDDKAVKEESKSFFAIDINKDGISDIFRLSPVKVRNILHGRPTSGYHLDTYLYISLSHRNSDGSVNYQKTICRSLGFELNESYGKSLIGSIQAMDIDGDGYNDIIIPKYVENKGFRNRTDTNTKFEEFTIFSGKDLANGTNSQDKNISMPLIASNDHPLFVTCDMNGNGKDYLICVEKGGQSGSYNGTIITSNNGTNFNKQTISFKLPRTPKKVFTGDYNDDGLTDLIFFFNSGYKIYYNNGGIVSDTKFIESNTTTSYSFGDCFRISQGDFNADGRPDFVYYVKDGDFNIAYNNGDGTFNLKQKAFTLSDVSNQPFNQDDELFNILVNDFDHDGLADIFICKANFNFRRVFDKTIIKWIYTNSDGTFSIFKSSTTSRIKDALSQNYFLGDFLGDGIVSLANYGTDLQNFTPHVEAIHTYSAANNFYAKVYGKITSITDGFGKRIDISYKTGTDPSIYSQDNDGTYPVNIYKIPISLVSSVISGNGVAGNIRTSYQYKNLRVHIAGKGLLGFDKVIVNNETLGTKEEDIITKWDETRWIPLVTNTITTIGSKSSNITSTNQIVNVDTRNYFVYTANQQATDLDGNQTTTFSSYDIKKGVPTEKTIQYGRTDMYKKVIYEGYVNRQNMWLPTSVINVQKHYDDNNAFSSKTSYIYDNLGNVLKVIEHDGTSHSLTTTRTYDVYGNVLTSISKGYGVKENMKSYTYDNTGLYIAKASESASHEITTFTYDNWGDILTQSDETNPKAILTTRYLYDGWNRKHFEFLPSHKMTMFNYHWGKDNEKEYYVQTVPTNEPAIKVWYDAVGHEVYTESHGPKFTLNTKTTSYNGKGLVDKVTSTIGKLSTTESYTYDERGRILSDALSTGKTTHYIYSNRCIRIKEENKTITKEMDAWNNVVKSRDPMVDVNYKYASVGYPSLIEINNIKTTFEYDDAGNKASVTDPDAGKITYDYSADNKVLSETNARGITTTNTYDNKGRLVSSLTSNTLITNEYGDTGNATNQLIKTSCGNNSIEYSYDIFGRVVSEKRTVEGYGTYSFGYTYDTYGLLASKTYPGGITVKYQYDNDGNKIQASVGKDVIYKLENYDGLVTAASFKGKLTNTRTLNTSGYETNINLTRGTQVLNNFNESYDVKTGNMIYRQINNKPIENFIYDMLDRLISVESNNMSNMWISYDPIGNIVYKTGIGNYEYSSEHPHAVSSVQNSNGTISNSALITEFNNINKIKKLSNAANGYGMTISYGPDKERWLTVLKKNGQEIRSTIYANDYEQVTENGVTRDFYYLDGNTIAIRQNGKVDIYQSFVDNLGSILSVVDDNGSTVFEATYDAWGKQAVTVNNIGLHKGYCGHEMLDEFDIINMNGRLYDPILGRFLSPDNYIQYLGNSQNLNKYSYCLNNPLKYNDPSGEFLHFLIGGLIGGIVNWATHGFKFNASGLKYFAVGAVAGALGAGVASGISSALPTIGKAAGGFAAGFWGTSTATTATSSFFSGALIGGGAGITSGFVSGFGNGLADRKSFSKALGQGALMAIEGGVSGAFVGGLYGGINAACNGRNFWDGSKVIETKTRVDLNVAQVKQNNENNCGAASVQSAIGVDQDDVRNYVMREYGYTENAAINTADLKDAINSFGHGTASPFSIQELPTSEDGVQQLTGMLNRGERIILTTETGKTIKHATVLNKITEKIIQKVSGKIVSKFSYEVMDPAFGAYRNIGIHSIINAIKIKP